MGSSLSRPTKNITLTDLTVQSSLTVDQTTLTVDDANDRVGVGTTTPSAQLDVQDATTSSANTGGKLRLSANDGSPMNDSHRLGVLEFTGAEDSSNTQVVGARIEALTDAAWTNAENGCALYFYTTDGNASQTNVLKIDSNKKSTFNGVLDITDTTDASDDTGDTGALRVEGGASIAKKLYVGTDLDVDGTANLDNTDIDGTFTMDGSTFDVNATGAVTVDGTTLSLDGTDTTNLTMTANSSSAKALSIDAVNSGSGVASINLGTTSGTAIVIGHTTSETTVSDNLTVTGDLTVNGTTTTINSTTLTVDDKTIVLASGAADSSAADGAGLSIDGASATFLYDHTGTQWEMNKPLEVTGNIATTGDLAVDGTSNLDEVDIDGATQIDATLSVGVNDTGYDVKFFGDTASAYMEWDASEDDLILGGAARVVVPDGQLVLASTAVSSTAAELNKLDGADGNVTAAKLSTLSALSDTEIGFVDGAGTAVVASKAIIADANKDVATIRNLTIDGTFSDGNYTFDTSGNVTGLGNVTMTGDLTVSGGDATFGNGQNATFGVATIGGSNATGRTLTINPGKGTGTGHSGDIVFQVTKSDGSSGSGTTTAQTLITMTGATKTTVFNREALFDGSTKAQFRDDGLYIYSSGDGILDIVSDTTVKITGATKLVSGSLNFGEGQNAGIEIEDTAHNVAGKTITMRGGNPTAGTTNDIAGGDVVIEGGQGKGQGSGGAIVFKTAKAAGGAGSSLNSLSTRLTISHKGELTFANDQDQSFGIDDTAHDTAGKSMTVAAGGPVAGTTNNIAGGALVLQGGIGKGTGDGGDIEFKVAKAAGGSGNSLNSLSTVMKIKSNKSLDIQGPIEVGVDDSGHDVKFYGATASAYMLWDESEDDLIMGGAARIVVPEGQLILGGTAVTATAAEIDGVASSSSRTAAAVAVADDHFMFYDGGATGASKVESIADLVTGIASSGLKASSGTLSNNRCNMNLIDDNLTLTADHNGRTIFVKELGASKTITLPSPAANYAIKIVYLHNNQTYDLIIKAAADTTFLYGLIGRLDLGGDGSGYVNSPNSYSGATAATFIGGASAETNNTVTFVDALAGTSVELFSDGTSWVLNGIIISSSPDATATFSQGDY